MNGNTHYALDYSYCFINSLASWILIPCRRGSDSHHPGYRGDCHSHQARDRSRCLSLRFRKASPKRMAATLFVRGAMTPCGAHNFLQYLIDFVFLHRPSRWFWVGFSSLSQYRSAAFHLPGKKSSGKCPKQCQVEARHACACRLPRNIEGWRGGNR
jgi:hypothetical protein